MFSGTAFPRIPFSGSAEVAEVAKVHKNAKGAKPPVIPFDTLLLASNEKRAQVNSDFHSLKSWQIDIKEHYAAIAPEIATQDAREFVAALCFLATRENNEEDS